jgi:hypothetical protein
MASFTHPTEGLMSDQKDVVEIIARGIYARLVFWSSAEYEDLEEAVRDTLAELEAERYTITRRSGVRHEQEEYVAR